MIKTTPVENKTFLTGVVFVWRTGWDSNPRASCETTWFRGKFPG